MKNSSAIMVVDHKKLEMSLYKQPLMTLDDKNRRIQSQLMHLGIAIAGYDRRQWALDISPTDAIEALLTENTFESRQNDLDRLTTLTVLQENIELFCNSIELKCYKDMLNGLKAGIYQGLLAESTDSQGNTLLHVAVQVEDEILISFLLQAQCSPLALNQHDDSPMSLALTKKSSHVLELLLYHVGQYLIQSSLNEINPALIETDELISRWAQIIQNTLHTVNEYGERYQRYSNWNIFFKFFTGYLFEEKRAEQLLIKLYTAIHEHGNDLNPTELQLAIKECIDEAGIGLFSSYLKYDLKQHEQVLKVDPEFKQQLVVRRDVLLKSQLGTLETTVVDLQSQVVRLSDDQKLKEKALEETSQQLSFLQSQIEAKSKETELFKQQLQASLEATQKAHAEAMMRLEEENHTLNEKVRTMKEAPTSTLTFIKGFESTPIPLAPKDEQRFAALEEKNQELSKQVEDLTRDMLTLLEVVKKKNDTHRLNSNATSQAPSNIHPSF